MNQECYDSWEGFVSAGFAAEDDGGIHLSGAKGWCCVWREDDHLRVQFGIDMPDVLEHRSEFDFPAVASTLQHWAALFARRSLGERRKLDLIGRADDEDIPRDLVELLQYGFDHEDSLPEAPPTEEVRRMPEHATEGADVEFFTAMHRTLEDAREGLWSRIDDSSERHDVGAAKESLAKLEKIDALVARVDDLEREWKAMGLATPVLATDEDEEELVGQEPDEESNAASLDDECVPVGDLTAKDDDENPRQDTPDAPRGHCTNFAVIFSDGERISESKGSLTFARVMTKIGPERVAALGIEMAGDPLVTRDRTQIHSMPQMVQEIDGGWFVKTHSSTYTKMGFIRRIADALDIELEIEQFYRKPLARIVRKKGRKLVRKHKKSVGGFQIGRVVKWYFPKLFSRGNVTEEEVAMMLSDESKKLFGTRGYPVLKMADGTDDDYIVNGQRRYYADILLEHGGRKYRLTSQFITSLSEPVLKWLESKGCSRIEMEQTGKGINPPPSLFDNLDLFRVQADDKVVPESDDDEDEEDGEEFSLHAEATTPDLFAVSESSGIDGKVVGEVRAADIKSALRREMKRLHYTPSALAAGLKIERRLVKGWYKGRGVLSAEQYAAICRHMGIVGLGKKS